MYRYNWSSAITDGLQVAVVPATTLKKWDRTHASIVRKAGHLPLAIPPETYFMSKNDGGIGLRSIWDLVTKDRIGNEILAVNHSEISVHTDKPSVLAQIARASRQHASIQGSLAYDTTEAMIRIGVTMHRTPHEYRTDNAAASDAIQANSNKKHTSVDIYTDGGTEDAAKGTPKTGWGWARYKKENTHDERKPIDTGAGRLEGEQSNDLGEAMAVMQALRATHTTDDATIYIDNTGVVLTTEKDTRNDPRARLKQGGRATWNRIQLMIAAREEAGAQTSFEWIHSHVDDPARRKWSDEWEFPCACGGQEKGECDPNHRHHKGNEAADEEATRGIQLQRSSESAKHTLQGEETFYLKDGDNHVQGNVWKALDEAIKRTRLQELEMRAMQQDKKKAMEWTCQTKLSDDGIRKSVANSGKDTRRFTIRAWTHTLCLYDAEAKKLQGAKGEVYGTLLEGGKCRCCHSDTIENEEHFYQCPSRTHLWEEAWVKLDRMWNQPWGPKNQEWENVREGWTKDTEGTKWKQSWQKMGLVPKRTTARITSEQPEKEAAHTIGLLKKTAKIMRDTMHAAWKLRNEDTQTWEKEVGISAEKKKMSRTGWAFRGPNTGQRGRPTKPDHDVAAGRVTIRDRAKKKAEIYAANDETEAAILMAAWDTKARCQRAQKAALGKGTGSSVMEWTVKGTSAKFKSNITKLRRRTATIKALTKPKTREECSIYACDEKATCEAKKCHRMERRCTRHADIKCDGVAAACRCGLEQMPKEQNPLYAKHTLQDTRGVGIGTTLRIQIDVRENEKEWISADVIHKHTDRRRAGQRWGTEHQTMTLEPHEHHRIRRYITVRSEDLMAGGWWKVESGHQHHAEESEESEDEEWDADAQPSEPETGGEPSRAEATLHPFRTPRNRTDGTQDLAGENAEKNKGSPTQVRVTQDARITGKRKHREENKNQTPTRTRRRNGGEWRGHSGNKSDTSLEGSSSSDHCSRPHHSKNSNPPTKNSNNKRKNDAMDRETRIRNNDGNPPSDSSNEDSDDSGHGEKDHNSPRGKSSTGHPGSRRQCNDGSIRGKKIYKAGNESRAEKAPRGDGVAEPYRNHAGGEEKEKGNGERPNSPRPRVRMGRSHRRNATTHESSGSRHDEAIERQGSGNGKTGPPDEHGSGRIDHLHSGRTGDEAHGDMAGGPLPYTHITELRPRVNPTANRGDSEERKRRACRNAEAGATGKNNTGNIEGDKTGRTNRPNDLIHSGAAKGNSPEKSSGTDIPTGRGENSKRMLLRLQVAETDEDLDKPGEMVETEVLTRTEVATEMSTLSGVPREQTTQAMPDKTGTTRQKTRSKTARAIAKSLPEQNTDQDGSGMGSSVHGETISNEETGKTGKSQVKRRTKQKRTHTDRTVRRSTVATTILATAMMTAAIRMEMWIDLTADPGHGENWQEAQQGTQYTQTPAEEWRNKKRPAASYTELTQAAQAAKRTKQTKLNLKQTLDEPG